MELILLYIEQLLNELCPKHNLDLNLLTERERLGLIGELFCLKLWKSIEKDLALTVSYKGFQSYNKKNSNDKRRVIDLTIRWHNRLLVANEVKMANTPKERYSYLALADRDVCARFSGLNPLSKLLTISDFMFMPIEYRISLEPIIRQFSSLIELLQ